MGNKNKPHQKALSILAFKCWFAAKNHTIDIVIVVAYSVYQERQQVVIEDEQKID